MSCDLKEFGQTITGSTTIQNMLSQLLEGFSFLKELHRSHE